jgi:uncharacterized membrane protein YfcA
VLAVAGLSNWLLVLTVVVVVIGAAVQASLGIGLGMIAAPILAIADTDFIPIAIIVAVIPLSGSVAWAERRHIDRRGVALTLSGRVPGVILGAVIISRVSTEALSIFVAISVLCAVAASASGRKLAVGDGILGVAGFASGFMATATGVGGPPIALTYQHADPPAMRATISTFFAVGAVMSLTALAVAGQVNRRQLELSLLVLPSTALGMLVASRYRNHLDPALVRPAVLVICTLSAMSLLIETLA